MSDNQKKKITMNTPLGVAKWPKLVEPDYGSKDFPKPDGEYSVKLIFQESDPAFAKFRAKLEGYMPAVEAAAQAKFAELKKPQRDKLGAPSANDLFTAVYDEDENPTGEVEAKFTMKASGVVKRGPRAGKKWSRAPQLFDAFGRPIKDKSGLQIWGGSELIVSFAFDPEGYFIPGSGAYGIKFNLDAVQIVTLRSGGERSAEDYGFKKQDGGFDASSIPSSGEDDGEGYDDDMDTDGSENNHGCDPEGASDF